MEFAYVFVEGWIIDPYIQSLFYGPAEVLILPPNNIEIFYGDLVTTDVTVVIDWWGGLLVFFKSLSKWPGGFTNVIGD